MTSSWHNRVSACISGCSRLQQFSKVHQNPCGYVHHGSVKGCRLLLPESCNFTFNGSFYSWPLSTEISSEYLNRFTILSIAVGNRPKVFANFRNIQSDNSLAVIGTKCWASTELWWMSTHPITQSRYPLLLPINLLILDFNQYSVVIALETFQFNIEFILLWETCAPCNKLCCNLPWQLGLTLSHSGLLLLPMTHVSVV